MNSLVSPFAVSANSIAGYIYEGDVIKFIGRRFHHEFVMPTILHAQTSESPFEKKRPIQGSKKIQACIEHWTQGVSWKETGVYDFTLQSIAKTGKPVGGCLTLQDIVKKYEDLDRLFDFVSKGGKIYSNFGNDAIVHIGPSGEILFGGGAHHRTSIAYILGVKLPVRPFLIHEHQKQLLSELIANNDPQPDQVSVA